MSETGNENDDTLSYGSGQSSNFWKKIHCHGTQQKNHCGNSKTLKNFEKSMPLEYVVLWVCKCSFTVLVCFLVLSKTFFGSLLEVKKIFKVLSAMSQLESLRFKSQTSNSKVIQLCKDSVFETEVEITCSLLMWVRHLPIEHQFST